MSDRSWRTDKIVIRPEDIPDAGPLPSEPPPAALPPLAGERILISSNQVDSFDKPPPEPKSVHHRGLKILLSLLVFAMLSLVLAVIVSAVIGRGPWIERLASNLGSGVVRIETSDDSLGTGFVIASRGDQHLVLTNRHVVGDLGNELTVVLKSGDRQRGTLVGTPTDQEIDLALVVVQSSELSPLGRIAYFDRVRIGQEVVAVGHPAGLDYTISQGIVSATRGNLWVQTSATLSPGNSGGPLINEGRQIVGVNTMTMEPDVAQSVGFAVRADLVLQREMWTYTSDVDDLLDRIVR